MADEPTDGSEDELMAGVVVAVDGGWSVGALPPLPTPSSDKHWQAAWGCALVGSIVGTCVVITELSVRWSGDHFSHIWIARWLVLAESVAAFGFHAGLLFGGQGCVVRRTDESCFPLPPEVATRLRDGAPLRDLANVEDGGATFCVRCLVWRREAAPAAGGVCMPCDDDDGDGGALYEYARGHHCRTCQRCVVEFDHHCGVLGRCITGTWTTGNMAYFRLLIAMGWAGALTTGVTAAFAVSTSRVPGWRLGMIVLGAYAALWVASLLCCVAQIAVRWVCSLLRTRKRGAREIDDEVPIL